MLDKINETIYAEIQEAASQIIDEMYGGDPREMAEKLKKLGSRLQMNVETRRIGIAIFGAGHNFAQIVEELNQIKQ
jgi:hypothetical protein